MEKKEIKIFGITIWRILAYFIIYSILGFVAETGFGFITKGVLESRQGFLYGPFCSIYGCGAALMIVLLQKFKKNKITLFFGGMLIGSILEYLISFFGELVFHVVWWDYSDRFLNINGRICLYFAFIWGFLSLFLMDYINPYVDRIINKIKNRLSSKKIKIIIIIGIIVLAIDGMLTVIGLKVFYARIVYTHDVDIANTDKYIQRYEKLHTNEQFGNFLDNIFSDKKILKTFPNLKLFSKDGDIIYISSLLPEIQPYYIKLFTPKKINMQKTQ